MKKSFLFIMIAMIGITASAADQTLEEYLVRRQAYSEKVGKPYDEAVSKKLFEKLDVNEDGILSDEEFAAAKKPKTK